MSVPSTDGYVHHPQKHRRAKYQGTYPFSKEDKVRLDLWSSTHYMALPEPSSNEAEEMGVVPSFPYKDVLIYGDTANIMALYFRDIWGCLLTPENVSDMADTSGIRYHVWVATKKVVDAVPLPPDCLSLWRVRQRSHDKHTLRKLRKVYVTRILRQFLFELGLAMLGAVKGSVIIFLDTRLHGSKIDMVNEACALVGLFDRADVRRWRVVITVMYSQLCTQPFFDRPQLPATEEGIRAAQILTSKYSIGVHLSMVTSLAHACACIEAGASMLSMNVAPILTWFEKKDGDEVEHAIDPGHPGIKTIQSSINYIRQNSLNTSLLLTDIRDVRKSNSQFAPAVRKLLTSSRYPQLSGMN